MKRIVIIGLGDFGIALLNSLLKIGYTHVIAIDKDEEVCRKITEEYGINVVNANAKDPTILEEIGIGEDDLVFVLTQNEDTNFFIALLLKRFGAKVVVRVKSQVAKELANQIKLENAINVDEIAAENVISKTIFPFEFSKLGDYYFAKIPAKAVESLIGQTVEEIEKKYGIKIINLEKGRAITQEDVIYCYTQDLANLLRLTKQ